MPPFTIDTEGLTPDLLQPGDNPILVEALNEVINPGEPMLEDVGFENKI